jgi:hypothetical protein
LRSRSTFLISNKSSSNGSLGGLRTFAAGASQSADTTEADIHARLKRDISLHCRMAATSPKPPRAAMSEHVFAVVFQLN